jgi:CheY-like chemotaxis protein
MEAIGQLAGGVAHDFNNLLTVISGYADELACGQPPGSDAQAAAAEILKAAEQGEALTRRLLGVSRPGESRRSAVDLNRVVTEIERMLARLLGEQVVLQLELEPALPAVVADPSHLEQILVNLAVNARDAMPRGGTLRIETGLRDGMVRLEVSDTGIGMDPQTRQRIFEAFFTTKPRGHGTGLGLSVVYSLVKDMAGAIWAESEHGRGTRMIVELPAAPESVHGGETRDPLPPSTRRDVGHETVLVAEDGDPVRYLVNRALEDAGYRVLTARDGQEALEIADSFPQPIDLVVSDVVMPRLGGFDLVRRLRAARPGTRFLFISGHPEQTGAPSTDLADVPLLAKPFRPAELCRRVRSVLDER